MISLILARVAIDPGLTGAVAKRYEESLRWAIHSMPLASESDIDSYALKMLLSDLDPATTLVSVENLHNFGEKKTGRKQRGTDVHFKNYGRLLGVLESLQFEIDYIMPISWQTSAEKKDKDSKEESIIKAIEWAPEIQHQLLKDGSKTVYSDGKAESVLMLRHRIVRPIKLKKGLAS